MKSKNSFWSVCVLSSFLLLGGLDRTQAMAGAIVDELSPGELDTIKSGASVTHRWTDPKRKWEGTVYQRVEGKPESVIAVFADYNDQVKVFAPKMKHSETVGVLSPREKWVHYELVFASIGVAPLSTDITSAYVVKDALSCAKKSEGGDCLTYAIDWVIDLEKTKEKLGGGKNVPRAIVGRLTAEAMGDGAILSYFNYVGPPVSDFIAYRPELVNRYFTDLKESVQALVTYTNESVKVPSSSERGQEYQRQLKELQDALSASQK